MFIPALRPVFIAALTLPYDLSVLSKAISQFNPATQFATGQLGGWYDPSDYATLSQDSAGTTPVTGVTQPVGQMLDKSGRSNTLSQATASARPLTNTQGAVKYDTFDGIDDGLSTGPITLGANMDCFIAIRTTDISGIIVSSNQSAGFYVAHVQQGGTGSAYGGGGGAGTPTFAVSGVDVIGGTAATNGQLYTDLCTGSWRVLEVRNFNPSTWAAFGIMGLYSGFLTAGDIAGIILCPAGDATARQKNRQFLGTKVGLMLP